MSPPFPFRVLYLDMNSFFASVEQHLDPALRGKPLGITAMEEEVGICVAASYEAKAYGVKTGTPVVDAKKLCPRIHFRSSRHRLYVRYNLAIADVLDRHAELMHIRSVDEFQLALSGEQQRLEGAVALVQRLKAAVAKEIGPCIRFSAGIGPNHLLAKIAGKLEKPNGCQWLSPDNMPDRLAELSLDDLPGISRTMLQRLNRAGVYDIAALYRLDPRHARMIWHSVEGERFVRLLQGEDIPLLATQRSGYGNSKVLAPEYRAPKQAYLVGRWLIEKAAARLRRDDRTAAMFSLHLSLQRSRWAQNRQRRHYRARLTCFPSQSTATFLNLHRQLWRELWNEGARGPIASLSVHLGKVALLDQRQGDLFLPIAPARQTINERASKAVDQVNARFGADTAWFGQHQTHHGFFERG